MAACLGDPAVLGSSQLTVTTAHLPLPHTRPGSSSCPGVRGQAPPRGTGVVISGNFLGQERSALPVLLYVLPNLSAHPLCSLRGCVVSTPTIPAPCQYPRLNSGSKRRKGYVRGQDV